MAPMKVVVALDSFKGSVSSREAGEAVRDGVLAAAPDAEVVVLAVADGGEGLMEAVAGGRSHQWVSAPAADAVGAPVEAPYLWLVRGSTAVLESAATVGLARMTALGAVDARLPGRASSWGLGVQVQHALDRGAERVLVGLGGTACSDGGAGLMLALGARLWAADGREIRAAAGENPLLAGPVRVELPDDARAIGLRLTGLVDVRSPLLGPGGAAHVFGPQKGATPEQVVELEERMRGWAGALADVAGAKGAAVPSQAAAASGALDPALVPGAGAAGGIGAAILTLGGRLRGGFDAVAAEVDLRGWSRGASLVLTGEGSIDDQTALGKVPVGVARVARQAGVPLVVALAGRVVGTSGDAFDAVMPIHAEPRPLAEAMDPGVTRRELAATAERVVRLVVAARRTTGTP